MFTNNADLLLTEYVMEKGVGPRQPGLVGDARGAQEILPGRTCGI